MELIHKALDFNIRQVGDPGDRILEFIGSTADVDRYGDIIEVGGWDLKHYQKNPQFLWAHNYNVPPVGTTRKVTKADGALAFQVYFPTDDEINVAGWPSHVPTPETVYRLYMAGLLRATSVGFQGLEWEPLLGDPDEQGYRPRIGTRYIKQDLYELSAVPVPANPYALVQQAVQKGLVSECQARLFREPDEKGVIPFKEYPADPEDAAWDGPAEIKAAEVADLKKMCAWFDSEKADAKGSYKLPHHRAKGYNTVWRGVSAAMGALLGARGGVNIPDADRKGVYNHLKKHYAQFDKEPPEFKEFGEADLVRIALGYAPNGLGMDDLFLSGILKSGELLAVPVSFTIAGEELKKIVADVLQEIRVQVQAEKKEPQSYYSLALNPGEEKPHGGRQAEESVNLAEILESTKKLHQTACPGK